ncbi:uncharacterized protein LOC141663966 isoform X2 [Apium graveolens]|uniref:uncharacterized protein LOC141663966 isoform X2 n=1 Tax=Apium graveolens TaxID=4045 RepID=UPI003D79040B
MSLASRVIPTSRFLYGDFKDCGRVEGEKEEAINVDESDTSTGCGHGDGDGQGNHRGGGDNGGNDSGGLGEGADWEEMRWFCWQIFKAWKYNDNLAKVSSSAMAGAGNIQVEMEGCLKKRLELNFDGRDQLQLTVFELLLLPIVLIVPAVCAALIAGILLFGCVLAALIGFWWSD